MSKIKRNKKGLLSFDFDGTLYNASRAGVVPTRLVKLIQELSQRNFVWGVNTGRSLEFLKEGIQQAGFSIQPDFIIAREREVYFLEEGLYREDRHWNQMMEQAHDEIFSEYSSEIDKMKSMVLEETKAQWISVPGDEAGIIATDLTEMDKILKMLDPIFKTCTALDYLHNTIYLRLTHRDYHKGTSLAYVAKTLSILSDSVFAMGDGENDLGMLDSEFAKKISCPANAAEVVKKQVRKHHGYVASEAEALGVIESLEYFYSNELTLVQ